MATKVMMPKLSDTMDEGKILKWLRKEGEKVKQGEPLVEIESDKADMELEAYDSGILRKIVVPDGGKAPIGALIGIIGEADEDIKGLLEENETPKKDEATKAPEKAVSAPEPSKTPEGKEPKPQDERKTDGRLKASPLARKIAQERGIRLDTVRGSGPQGRIIKRDLERTSGGFSRLAQEIVPGTSEEVELSGIRKTIAKRMAESKTTAPHFYVTVDIDMEPAMAFREQILNATELKLSYTDILIKAAAMALMKHPYVNGTYLGDKVRLQHFAHIGVAVALDEGLVTPVIRNCEQKRIDQINSELRDLVTRARNRKLKPEEYQGSTFTISNLGMFDVEDFVAIINPPEGAILAVGSIVERPVVRDGAIVIGHTMKVTLSSDHRIIDGAVAARFLQDLKKFMQNPAALTL
ncbi:MAG: dihydrolipoamide acetyltransferase component of pyruvate dehydrogenase complex [Bacteroidia bacterium]|nr:MAG: dihydrolipoamide acetyltransferase component of pyruvate dehydrogenase complex [Bacteroidia bacterium]